MRGSSPFFSRQATGPFSIVEKPHRYRRPASGIGSFPFGCRCRAHFFFAALSLGLAYLSVIGVVCQTGLFTYIAMMTSPNRKVK